jgi:hypothetical protein
MLGPVDLHELTDMLTSLSRLVDASDAIAAPNP